MQTEKRLRIKKSFIIKILLLLIIILTSFIGWKFYYQDKNLNNINISEKERDDIISKVGKHIVLPTDEIPSLATVSDVNQLKKYPFFAKAMKGDKVLIYSVSKKAILYRPSEDKILEVAPVLTEDVNSSSSIKL